MYFQILEIQRESASWFSDAFRSVFWFLAKGPLILLDGMFEIINDIWKFKFFDNDYVNKIYSAAIIVACTWLILKIMLELIMRYFVEQEDNNPPTKIMKGVVFCIVMMFLIPPLFNWGYDLSSKMTEYVVSVSSDGASSATSIESSMSSMILTAFADNDKMSEEDKLYFIDNWFTVDYNEVVDDGLFDSGKYKYSFSTFTIFLVGIVVVILLFFIGIQVSKRVIELALYKAIAPFVCTSLVSTKSHAFEVWAKGVMGTFLVTTVQYLCIGILFNVFGQVSAGTNYAMSVILIVIGALLFIISSPQLVSSLLNANTGATSNLGGLSTLTALGTSMIAMSRYGKTVDNSSNSNTNSDNSTSTNSNNSSSGTDPNMNNNTSSNLDSASNNSSNNSEDNSNNTNNNNSNTDSSNNEKFTNDNSLNSLPVLDTTSNLDSMTSITDRIEVYKDMTNSTYSLDDNSSMKYKTSIDWGNSNVSNTKEHKS